MAANKASLKILAEYAGVSKATASWVLSGQGRSRGISPDTCEKVMNKAKELGYRPNRLAQGLPKGVPGTGRKEGGGDYALRRFVQILRCRLSSMGS